MERRENILAHIDWLTILLYGALVFAGWLSIYAASSTEEVRSIFDISQSYGRQLMWIGLAVLLIIIILAIDAKFFSAFSFIIYIFMLSVLIMVLVFGKTVAGSTSWFEIGSFAIQPAEFAKFATALALAKYLSMLNIDMRKLRTKVSAAAIALLPSLLILLQNDTGSAIVYVAFVLVLFREGLSGIFIILGGAMAALFVLTLKFGEYSILIALTSIAVFLLFFFKKIRKNYPTLLAFFVFSVLFVLSVNFAFEKVLEPHQKKRINVMLGIEEDKQGAGYNVNQSKIAIGSGGFTGKGFRQGMLTRYNFVPEQTTDFIFCTVGEEWGFLGVTVVVALFVALLLRLIKLAERQRSKFSRIYGYGVASILFFHFAINVGMTIGLAPVVGIPLPFFSYGGSSLWGFTILLFVFIKQDANRVNVL
ncbi:MAG TPA: rod shape-determining protein RodA [Bacteroidales bacterium]